jgi:hypothetical protein
LFDYASIAPRPVSFATIGLEPFVLASADLISRFRTWL